MSTTEPGLMASMDVRTETEVVVLSAGAELARLPLPPWPAGR